MIQLTNIFKILSDDTRLRILLLLYQQNLCVCEIIGILDVPQSRVSKNLSKLRDLNIVTDERKEKFVYYSLNKEDSLLISTLQNIFERKDSFPVIVSDFERMKEKEKYVIQLGIICD